MREYGPERLRVVFKHHPLPFHEDALPAALTAQAVYQLAGPAAFFAYVELVFRGQKDLTDANLLAWSAEVGVDRTALLGVATSKAVRAKIDSDVALAEAVGLRGTPAFLINGSRLVGAQPYEEFKQRVDAELDAVKDLTRQGVGKLEVYAARVAKNLSVPEPDDDAPTRPPPDTTVWKVPVGKSPTLGPANAPVTLVEFSDYQCPYCRKAHRTVDELVRLYKGKLRVVFKHQPLAFHRRALPAAVFAMEARAQKGDKGFWEATRLLFESAPALEDDDLVELGRKMKLNLARVKAALAKEHHKAAIEADQALAEDVTATGTPAFYVNGRKLSGAQPLEKFRDLIDAQLSEAEAKVRGGVPAAKVYDALIKDGRAGKPFELAPSTPSIPKGSPTRGPAKAPVTIQVFSDFQCPFCSRVLPSLTELEKRYAGRVRFVWRNMPLSFHKDARPAAQLAMEAHAQKGNAAFWRMHDLLFANQSSLDRGALEGYAQKVGLDLARVRTALDPGSPERALDEDEAAARAAGVNGTPAFLINGYSLSGAQPLRAFTRVVDRALEDAKLGRKPAP
jgi:protein-disulfide isomerase